MQQKPQFSLRSLVLCVTVIAAYLAIARVVALEWRLVLVVAGVTLVLSLASLLSSGQPRRSVVRCLLAAVSIASASLLVGGLRPGMYYMEGLFFAILLWTGVVIGSLLIAITSSAFSETGTTGLRTKEVRLFLIVPIATTLLLAFQVPLRVGAVTAIPTLASKVSNEDSGDTAEQRCGIYTIRLPGKRQGRGLDQVYFQLADDSETAFVYSPSGMEDISYNPGTRGHLFGNWYWIAND